MKQQDTGESRQRLQRVHCRLAVAERSSPQGEQVEVQMRLIKVVDRLVEVVPVEQPLHRMKRMGADPARDFEVGGIVDVVGFEQVVSRYYRPERDQLNPGPLAHGGGAFSLNPSFRG